MTNGHDGVNPLVIHGRMLNGEDDQAYKGMTKREYFAAMAMAGGASPKAAVAKADEVIKELNKTETK